MPSTSPRPLDDDLLDVDDLDDLRDSADDSGDPLGVADLLVSLAEPRRLADPADIWYPLMLAAEIHHEAGRVESALELITDAVTKCRTRGDQEYCFPQSYRAVLLFELGRDGEAMEELSALRPLLTQDPDFVSSIIETLREAGRKDEAQQWMAAALHTVLESGPVPRPPGKAAEIPDAELAGAANVYVLATMRHEIREELGLPHDDLDDLADRLSDVAAGYDDEFDDELDGEFGDGEVRRERAPVPVFWPATEYRELLGRWPALAEIYGATWDEHRARIEAALTAQSRRGAPYALITGTVDGLERDAAGRDHDPADPALHDDYGVSHEGDPLPWPPGRNAPCWCGSGIKYKKCCRPRA